MNGTVLYSLGMLQESLRGVVSGTGETAVEPTIVNLVSWFKLFVELTGAAIIAIGIGLAFVGFFRVLIASEPENYNKIWCATVRWPSNSSSVLISCQPGSRRAGTRSASSEPSR